MPYYITFEDGSSISQWSDTKFSPAAAYTDKKIVTAWDGKFYIEGEEPQISIESIIAGYETRIQARLDNFARTLTYDSIISACSYATDPKETYRIEGQYCVAARSATWDAAWELLSAFQPGDPIPTWEAIEAQLPPLAWPEGSRGYKGE